MRGLAGSLGVVEVSDLVTTPLPDANRAMGTAGHAGAVGLDGALGLGVVLDVCGPPHWTGLDLEIRYRLDDWTQVGRLDGPREHPCRHVRDLLIAQGLLPQDGASLQRFGVIEGVDRVPEQLAECVEELAISR